VAMLSVLAILVVKEGNVVYFTCTRRKHCKTTYGIPTVKLLLNEFPIKRRLSIASC